MRTDRAIKLISIICLGLVIGALVLAWNTPATGWESSVYAGTPILTWLFLSLSIACGTGIAVHQVLRKEAGTNSLWVVGLLLIILGTVGILSLHIIRGYAMWCTGDPAWHLGALQDAIRTGHLEKSNFYPATAVYATELYSILSIEPIRLVKYLPLFFSVGYIASMYLLSNYLLPNKGQVVLATVASTALIHGWYLNFTPNHLANLFMPLVLYIAIKRFTSKGAQFELRILFILLIFTLPLFHPVPAFSLLAFVLAMWLATQIFSKAGKKLSIVGSEQSGDYMVCVLILTVWSITWLSNFYVWDRMILNVYTLVTEGGQTHVEVLLRKLALGQEHGRNLAEFFFKAYGGILIYIILTLLSVPKLLIRGRNSFINSEKLKLLYGPLILFVLAYVALYGLHLPFSPGRLQIYAIVIGTFFVGWTLYEMAHQAGKRKFAIAVVIVILLAGSADGILRVYPSPYLLQENYQATRQEITGMNWFFSNKLTTIDTASLSIVPSGFANFLLSSQERERRRDIPWGASILTPAEHFNYIENSAGVPYTEQAYMVIGERDRVVYGEIMPQIASYLPFLPQDFEDLETKLNGWKIYTDNGVEVWYIQNAPRILE